MRNRVTWLALLVAMFTAAPAKSQELILPAAERQAREQYVLSLRYFDKFLPQLVNAGSRQPCEYNQYPVTCYEITGTPAKLLATSNRYLKSFPKAADSDLASFINIRFQTKVLRKERELKYWMIASPHPPYIPFAAYDGQKSHVGDLRSRGDDFVNDPKNFEGDEYLSKVDSNNFAQDSRFDKGISITEALKRAKSAGFNFFEREHDGYVGLDAPAFFLSKDIEGGDLAEDFWLQFYKRSSERSLNWGDDCSRCSIVTKTQLSKDKYILSYCTVEATKGVRGVPQNCMPVMYVNGKETSLRSIAFFEYVIGLGAIPSGYQLTCKPTRAAASRITWPNISDDVTAVLTGFNYIPVKSRTDDHLKFINEFGESKLDKSQNEWTTVSVDGDLGDDGKPLPASGFFLKLDLNFSLRNEVDRTRYRPSSVTEEIDGLRKLGNAFRDKYLCSVDR